MIERVLVPIDGGSLSERALKVSLEFARQLGAVVVGFIVEPFVTPPLPGGTPHASEASLQAHAYAVLDRFGQSAREAGVPFEGAATQSDEVSQAIVAAAREHCCDMIIMATHGRGVIDELIRGSTTRAVLLHSDLPVLVLR